MRHNARIIWSPAWIQCGHCGGGRISEVSLPGWVTILWHTVLVFNQANQANSASHPHV